MIDSWVVITGFRGGIGQQICRLLRARGLRIFGIDEALGNSADLADASTSIDLAHIARSDLALTNLVEEIVAVIGGSKLVGLVNNAAVQITDVMAETSRESWLRTLDVNVTAPFMLIKTLREVLRAGEGSVVNISSIHARLTKPGFTAYSTSKAALSGMTRALAIEFASEVPVFGVEPGAVDTPMLRAGFEGNSDGLRELNRYQPLGRIARPEELAELVHYLISSRPLLLSGAVLEAGGGIASRLHDPA